MGKGLWSGCTYCTVGIVEWVYILYSRYCGVGVHTVQ